MCPEHGQYLSPTLSRALVARTCYTLVEAVLPEDAESSSESTLPVCTSLVRVLELWRSISMSVSF